MNYVKVMGKLEKILVSINYRITWFLNLSKMNVDAYSISIVILIELCLYEYRNFPTHLSYTMIFAVTTQRPINSRNLPGHVFYYLSTVGLYLSQRFSNVFKRKYIAGCAGRFFGLPKSLCIIQPPKVIPDLPGIKRHVNVIVQEYEIFFMLPLFLTWHSAAQFFLLLKHT